MVLRDVRAVEIPFEDEIIDNQSDLEKFCEVPGTVEKESEPLEEHDTGTTGPGLGKTFDLLGHCATMR